jgi:hypothetical protein
VVTIVVPASAEARSNTASSKKLGSGVASVTACGDLSKVVTDFAFSGTKVSAVSLTNIPATCNGGSLSATVARSNNASLGAGGPVTVAGGSATVPISPTAASANVASVRVVIVGP